MKIKYKPFTTNSTSMIIDDIRQYLLQTSNDQTTIDTLDLCHLIGEIERVNKNNKDGIEFIERYLNLNLEAFDTKGLLNKLLEILKRGEKK